jgi:hypothetical protein
VAYGLRSVADNDDGDETYIEYFDTTFYSGVAVRDVCFFGWDNGAYSFNISGIFLHHQVFVRTILSKFLN